LVNKTRPSGRSHRCRKRSHFGHARRSVRGQDERHPSTVYEYDDDLFTSMRDFERDESRDAEGRQHGQRKDHVGVQIDIAACKSPAANAASPARSRSIASSDT